MSFPIRPLTAALLIMTGWLPLSGDTLVAGADHGFAEPSSPTRRSSAVGVGRRPVGECILGCDGEAKKVIERALAAYRSLETYQDTLIVAKGWHDREGPRKMGPSMKTACSFAKPNRIALTGVSAAAKKCAISPALRASPARLRGETGRGFGELASGWKTT